MRHHLQAPLALAAMVAVACAEGPTVSSRFEPDPLLAKGGGGTAVSVTVNDQDPGLTATGDPFSVSIPSNGGVEVKPTCSTGRLDLVNMPALDGYGARSFCNGKAGAGFVFLKTWSGTTGAVDCSTVTSPSGTNFSAADGRYDDAQYTIVLTDCAASGTSPARTVTATSGKLYDQAGTFLGTIGIGVSITY
jgi:hypothetical protein